MIDLKNISILLIKITKNKINNFRNFQKIFFLQIKDWKWFQMNYKVKILINYSKLIKKAIYLYNNNNKLTIIKCRTNRNYKSKRSKILIILLMKTTNNWINK